jgi:uncharacterized protein with HEPN domain
MRREELYLRDIVEAADHVANFLAGVDFRAFSESELLRSAVVQKLAVIGEAAARLPKPLHDAHPETPWPRIVAFRNILIHSYFGVDWDVVWIAATKEAPALREQVDEILRNEFGEPA